MPTPLSKLRRQALQHLGYTAQQKGTRKPLRFEDEPDRYPKTPKMKYIELRFRVRLEQVIFKGSLAEVRKGWKNEVDRSTILRWRRYISKVLEKQP